MNLVVMTLRVVVQLKRCIFYWKWFELNPLLERYLKIERTVLYNRIVSIENSPICWWCTRDSIESTNFGCSNRLGLVYRLGQDKRFSPEKC